MTQRFREFSSFKKPVLIMGIEEASKKIAVQITLGKALSSVILVSDQTTAQKIVELKNWDMQNEDILKTIFSNGAIALRYSDCAPIDDVYNASTLSFLREKYNVFINTKIDMLLSIREELSSFAMVSSDSTSNVKKVPYSYNLANGIRILTEAIDNTSNQRVCWDSNNEETPNKSKKGVTWREIVDRTDKVEEQLTSRDNIDSLNKKVFIVHGHDGAVREQVARFIEKLGLNPVILHEQANSGRTIIEKLEANSDVGFAIVLLTPDDEGKLKNDPNPCKGRARQNVIAELGYFIGKLGRDKVCPLYVEGVEIPSDFNGVTYTLYDIAGGWKLPLCRELKKAGYHFDADKLL